VQHVIGLLVLGLIIGLVPGLCGVITMLAKMAQEQICPACRQSMRKGATLCPWCRTPQTKE
jgi:predicted amidophosphoribosyltransferase